MDTEKLKQRLIEIVQEKDDIEQQLRDTFIKDIKEVAIQNPFKNHKHSDHIVIVKRSELDGKLWSPSFYNWEESVETVLNFLKKKPLVEWKSALENKLAKDTKSGVVKFTTTVNTWPWPTKLTIPVDENFIKKIIENL